MTIRFSEDEKFILEKIQSYCHYQERCIKEVRNKLFSLKANNNTADKILQSLIDNDYLNEDRYAKMFIQGKLRIKKWGKIKFLKGTKDQKKRSFINYFTYRGWENSLIYQKLKDIN